jgi:hypothetical protein
MNNQNPDRTSAIDSAHPAGEPQPPHHREQLRRRLLKMILQNEAQRRSLEHPTRRSTGSTGGGAGDPAADLAVFDPEDFIGKELAASHTPQKPA